MRIEGWEKRLNDLVEGARIKGYQVGRHDCALFALDVVEAVTGRDLGKGIRGAYNSEIGSYRTMRALVGGRKAAKRLDSAPKSALSSGRSPPFAGELLGRAVTAVLGTEPVQPALAMRGDPMLYREKSGPESPPDSDREEGQEHLGICLGAEAAVLGEAGLRFFPITDFICAWRT